MKSNRLDSYFLANLIANTINSQIKKECSSKKELNFYSTLNYINEYEKNKNIKIIKLINYVVNKINMLDENCKKTITDNILDNIEYLILTKNI